MIWIVTNDWRGNAHEGVIVEAEDSTAAVEAARAALIAEWTASTALDAAEHLESYGPDSDLRWWAEAITLPHVGEF